MRTDSAVTITDIDSEDRLVQQTFAAQCLRGVLRWAITI